MAKETPPKGGVSTERAASAHQTFGLLGTHPDWVALLNRAGRPALFAALGACLVLFLLGYGSAMIAAAWIAALKGQAVPDMLGALVPFLLGLAPMVFHQYTRHVEKVKGVA